MSLGTRKSPKELLLMAINTWLFSCISIGFQFVDLHDRFLIRNLKCMQVGRLRVARESQECSIHIPALSSSRSFYTAGLPKRLLGFTTSPQSIDRWTRPSVIRNPHVGYISTRRSRNDLLLSLEALRRAISWRIARVGISARWV